MKSVSLPLFTESRAAAEKPRGWPFLRLGFRPFYVGGALTAALLVPLWLAIFLGGLPWRTAVPGLLWHAHEMLFGFAAAIVIGFLMTAGKTWTGLATPRGPLLGALALLWLAARLAGLADAPWLYAALDVLLLPLIAVIFARLLLRSKNYRNLPLALILLLLGSANGWRWYWWLRLRRNCGACWAGAPALRWASPSSGYCILLMPGYRWRCCCWRWRK